MQQSTLRRNLLAWFAREGRDLPWRRTRDPYAITVSEFMLQQTQVSTVLPYYTRWMQSLPNIATLANASEETVLSLWQGLGYYSRARNLHRLAQTLHAGHNGVFPADFAALRALPGIGEYTACAILAFAFDLPAPVVDGNIARVLTRWFDHRDPIDTSAGKSWLRERATELQPPGGKNASLWNSAVMELGATLCRAGRPDCLLCPVRRQCQATDPSLLPRKSPRPPVTHLTETRALFRRSGQILLRQSSGPRWKGLWCLPETPPIPGESPLATLIYPITRYRVSLHLVARPFPRKPPADYSPWPLKALPPMPTPDRRILHQAGLYP